MSIPHLTRRSLLNGGVPAAGALVVGFVWARATVDDKSSTGGANSYGPAASGGERLVALSDVPADGGVVVKSASVVVVRDADGVHAFSAVCTHQGCLVSSVTNGSISCPCHGSVFDAKTGEPTNGPATRALAPVKVTVNAGEVVQSGGGSS